MLACSSPGGSWHVDYRDTAFVYFGGLPYDLSEGDIITIFSQYGEPVFLKLVRDKESGKSKGFGWLKYEDQRSTDLAVDNLCGAEIGGRALNVDHARYEARDDEDAEEFKVGWQDIMRRQGKDVSDDESSDNEPQRPLLQEERELAKLIQDHDEDDPMKAFLIEEKKKEVDEARRRADKKEKRHRHKHHGSHRSRPEGGDGADRHRRPTKDRTSHDEERRHRDKDSRRHRSERDDSRDGERGHDRRDKDDGDGKGRRRDAGRERRRHDRDDSDREERRRRRREDDEDEYPRRERRRSRSPRRSEK
jgi:RNA-binding motif protein, X-linked 2